MMRNIYNLLLKPVNRNKTVLSVCSSSLTPVVNSADRDLSQDDGDCGNIMGVEWHAYNNNGVEFRV